MMMRGTTGSLGGGEEGDMEGTKGDTEGTKGDMEGM